MKRAPSLASVMTPFPHAIDAAESVAAARAMMQEHDFHHLPVTREGELVSVISTADITLSSRFESIDTEVPVAKICASPPYIVDIHTRLSEVVTQMAERRSDSALVTRQGKLVGILTHTDVSRLLARALRTMSGDAPGDDDVA